MSKNFMKKENSGGKGAWLFCEAKAKQKCLASFSVVFEENMIAPKRSGTFWFY